MAADETPRIETEGVAVNNGYGPEEFAVPSIAFEIRSERSSAAEIRIGFHPAYDGERWSAHDDGRLVFEDRIEPETTVVTVYGIRISDDETAARFMTEPDLTVRAVEVAPNPSIEMVADGAGETLPVVAAPGGDEGVAPVSPSGDGVAAALAAELRAGTVTDEDRETLRDALEAYGAAFEGFLDENGTAEALGAEIGAVADEQRSALAAAVDDHEGITADVDAVSDDLDALFDQVDELHAWRERMGVAFDIE